MRQEDGAKDGAAELSFGAGQPIWAAKHGTNHDITDFKSFLLPPCSSCACSINSPCGSMEVASFCCLSFSGSPHAQSGSDNWFPDCPLETSNLIFLKASWYRRGKIWDFILSYLHLSAVWISLRTGELLVTVWIHSKRGPVFVFICQNLLCCLTLYKVASVLWSGKGRVDAGVEMDEASTARDIWIGKVTSFVCWQGFGVNDLSETKMWFWLTKRRASTVPLWDAGERNAC